MQNDNVEFPQRHHSLSYGTNVDLEEVKVSKSPIWNGREIKTEIQGYRVPARPPLHLLALLSGEPIFLGHIFLGHIFQVCSLNKAQTGGFPSGTQGFTQPLREIVFRLS